MRKIIAYTFQYLFKIPFLKNTYYGLYKKVFLPVQLFKGVEVSYTYSHTILLNLDLQQWISQQLFFLGNYEAKELGFVKTILQPGDTFIDVGANIGLFSLVAAKQMQNKGRVLAFEPFTKNYTCLQNHIQQNKLTIIDAKQLAVSDTNAIVQLQVDETEYNNGMVSQFANKATFTESVTSICLDDYASNITNITLIKIDIEGGEFAALKGMQQILISQSPIVLVEVNEQTPYARNELFDWMKNLGYETYYLQDDYSLSLDKSAKDFSWNYVFRK